MLLPDHEIRGLVDAGIVGIDPFDPALIQPASIDVRLFTQFRIQVPGVEGALDPREGQDGQTELVERYGEPFTLWPGEFVLASTTEWVTLPDDIAGRIEGKSSMGRHGLMLHSTAGWIDPGFTGRITLELSNIARAPIRLWPGDPIGQLCLMRMSSAAERPYGSPGLGSRYQCQTGPTAARAPLREMAADGTAA